MLKYVHVQNKYDSFPFSGLALLVGHPACKKLSVDVLVVMI